MSRQDLALTSFEAAIAEAKATDRLCLALAFCGLGFFCVALLLVVI